MVALVGPTAAGKTAVAMELAETFGGAIISADSRQIYRGMDIGTAKPTPDDRARIPHYMLDLVAPDATYSAGQYGRDARAALKEVVRRGHLPLVVGGSGLYLRALFDGLSPYPKPAPEVVTELRSWLREEGSDALYRKLAETDPAAAATIGPRDGQRLVRALALARTCGEPLCVLRAARPPKPLAAEVLFVGLWLPRQELYARIDARVEAMMARGLLNEIHGLLARGFGSDAPGLTSLGYHELIAFLDGAWDLRAAVSAIQRSTRRLAKRQLTWFRADRRVNWLEPEPAAARTAVRAFLRTRGIGRGSNMRTLAT